LFASELIARIEDLPIEKLEKAINVIKESQTIQKESEKRRI